jgi:hypothetical protein
MHTTGLESLGFSLLNLSTAKPARVPFANLFLFPSGPITSTNCNKTQEVRTPCASLRLKQNQKYYPHKQQDVYDNNRRVIKQQHLRLALKHVHIMKPSSYV